MDGDVTVGTNVYATSRRSNTGTTRTRSLGSGLMSEMVTGNLPITQSKSGLPASRILRRFNIEFADASGNPVVVSAQCVLEIPKGTPDASRDAAIAELVEVLTDTGHLADFVSGEI